MTSVVELLHGRARFFFLLRDFQKRHGNIVKHLEILDQDKRLVAGTHRSAHTYLIQEEPESTAGPSTSALSETGKFFVEYLKPAAPGDIAVALAGEPAPGSRLNDAWSDLAALGAELAEGGAAFLDRLQSRLGAAPAPFSCLAIEVR